MSHIQITDLNESEEITQTVMQSLTGGVYENFCGTVPGPSIMPGGCYVPPWIPSVPGWVPDLEPPIHILPL